MNADVMNAVPRKNREQIRHWAEALADGSRAGDAEWMDRIRSFSEYIVQLVAEKRQHQQEDLMSQLIQIEEEGGYLSEAELLSIVRKTADRERDGANEERESSVALA